MCHHGTVVNGQHKPCSHKTSDSSPSQGHLRWSTYSSNGHNNPGPRSSHTLTAVGSTLYVLGGEVTPRLPLPAEVCAFDLEQQRWTALPASGEQPCPVLGHSTTAIGAGLFVFGGRTGTQVAETTLNELHVFDTQHNSWSKVTDATGSPPEPRSYHAAASVDASMYIFGGCGEDGRLSDLHEYNTSTNSWQSLLSNTDIKPRGGASMIAYKQKLFLIGGFSGQELSDVHVYDLNKRQGWEEVSGGQPLRPCSVFACGVSYQRSAGEDSHETGNDWIVAFGGEVDPSDLGHAGAGNYSDETFGLNPAKLWEGWKKLDVGGKAPSPRGWLASTSCVGGVALHGGNAPDNSRLDDMYILT